MRAIIHWLLPVIAIAVLITSATAQEDELELIDSVSKLQQQLTSDNVDEQDNAEKQLIELGAKILEYLEPPGDDATTDYKDRLTRIRTTLEKITADQAAKSSTVTLKGSMSVAQALKKLQKQTGNDIEINDMQSAEKKLELDLVKVEFWEAMQQIMSQAKLAVDRYGSEKPGQIMLAPTGQGVDFSRIPVAHSKIFQTQVLRVDSSVNLEQPALNYTTISLLVRWEPRLRPISVDVPMRDVKVVDEFGDAVKLTNPEEVVYGMVQPEIPEVEFSITLPRVDRQVETLKSITAKIDTLLPGKTEIFRFKKVDKLKPGTLLEKAGAKVRFGGSRKNEDVYSVKLSISFDEENNALESHQGWVFQNEVYLEDSQGKREEAISLETLQQDNTVVTVQYYFLNEPGDRSIVYKTPASVVKLPVQIELTKIPLP